MYNTEAKKLSEFSRMTLGYDFPENTLTKEVVEAWITRRPTDADKTVYSRFCTIKGFAEYMARHGYNSHTPSSDDLPVLHFNSYVPHVFSHEEIRRFFQVYEKERLFRTVYSKRYSAMMKMIFKLLYCCGLRVSEATGLKEEDVDLKSGVLTIRFAKFQKTRYVPMSASLQHDLKDYMDSYPHSPYLFPSYKGTQLQKNAVYDEFRRVLQAANIPHYGRGKGPRVHDLRHTFACHCLQGFAEQGIDVSAILPRLSTFLGHSDMAATERYIHMTAEVFPKISEKLSEHYGFIIPKGE